LKVAAAFAFIAACSAIQIPLLVLLLPFRRLRIITSNLYVKAIAAVCLSLSRIKLDIAGRQHLDRRRPAIYVSNHVSLLDVLIAMRLAPLGTTAVAKKEILWIPFIGLVYLLSGSLLIDRNDRTGAISALRRQAELVRRLEVSIMLWPEGTRSRTGRLLPFKKGFAHLALQTGLPVVAIVVSNAHKAWKPTGYESASGARVRVDVLPAIDTTGWSAGSVDDHVAEVRAMYLARLCAHGANWPGRAEQSNPHRPFQK
jgi:1-acyl-sn-glycerol-3-phosphate acyltransferase